MPIKLDKERHMLFSLNVMDELEDRVGSIDNLTDALNGQGRLKFMKWLLTALLNEGAEEGEPELTEKQVGKMIHSGNFKELETAIYQAFTYGNRGTIEPPEEDDEADEEDGSEERKNTQAGKVR